MIQAADLPDTIPVFPLAGALLLPGTKLPLHIFEPRYLQMLEDSLKTRERLVGLVQPSGDRRDPQKTGLHAIGCAGRVSQFSETEDGRYFITLSGICRFRTRQEIEGFTPYLRYSVDWCGFERDLQSGEGDAGFDRDAVLMLLRRYMDLRGVSTDWGALEQADADILVNSLSMLLDFGVEDKQALLEAPSLTTRRETLVTLMEFALRSGCQEERKQ